MLRQRESGLPTQKTPFFINQYQFKERRTTIGFNLSKSYRQPLKTIKRKVKKIMSFKKLVSKIKYNINNPNQMTSGNQSGKVKISNSLQKFKMGEREIRKNARFINSRQ